MIENSQRWFNRPIVMVLFRSDMKRRLGIPTTNKYRPEVYEKGHDFGLQLIRRITCMPCQ